MLKNNLATSANVEHHKRYLVFLLLGSVIDYVCILNVRTEPYVLSLFG
jgi:hypothetical protein